MKLQRATRGTSIVLGFLACYCGAAPAAAQSSAASLIKQAYQRTSSAASAEQFTEIIDLCGRAEAAGVNQEQSDYLKRLLGWSHNKRGELYADQAAAASDAGDADEAARWDALALEDFERSVAYDPTRFKTLHNRGVSYALAGNYQAAVADFTRVIELHSEHANAWFNRAEIRYELGQLDQAIEDYTEVLRLTPRDFGAYTGRGHAHFLAGRLRVALADYEQALALQPRSADAHANRGDAHQGLGLWEQAAEDYRQAVRLDPHSARAYESAAWLMATCPDERFRNAELAQQAAAKAVELRGDAPPDVGQLDTLAAVQANAGRFDEAQQTLAGAITLASGVVKSELQNRLRLYQAQQPYRLSTSSGAQILPASARQ